MSLENLEHKVDEMRDMLHEMKPMLAVVVQGQDKMDSRLRISEVACAAQEFKITQMQKEIGLLWSKSRPSSQSDPSSSGAWMPIIEVLAALPRYWHVILTVGATLTSIGIMIWRHGR